MDKVKGIVLAGGVGSRLYPLTKVVSKQLLPVYDKPMIYYPISVLMLAKIQDILIITTPSEQTQFKHLLGDGSQWGLKFSYQVQPEPGGLAQAFILAEDYLDGSKSAMILGDNIFFGHGLTNILCDTEIQKTGATIFGYHVSDPERYGVLDFNNDGEVAAIIEKPNLPPSNYAITGLYFLDESAPYRAKKLKPSRRGELEITSLLETYLQDGTLKVIKLGRGYAWLDTGTFASLLDAGNFVRTITQRQGLKIGSPEDIAKQFKWIKNSY